MDPGAAGFAKELPSYRADTDVARQSVIHVETLDAAALRWCLRRKPRLRASCGNTAPEMLARSSVQRGSHVESSRFDALMMLPVSQRLLGKKKRRGPSSSP